MAVEFFSRRLRGLSQLIDDEARFEGVQLCSMLVGQDAGSVKPTLSKGAAKQKETLALLAGGGIARPKNRGEIRPTESLPLGTEFRLEFPLAHRAKYYLGLQQSPQGWGTFNASPKKQGKVVHVPQPLENGELDVMAEKNDLGDSRFTLIQTVQPFPMFIYECLRDGIPLNRTDIGLLTRHLQELPKSDRTFHVIDIRFTEQRDL